MISREFHIAENGLDANFSTSNEISLGLGIHATPLSRSSPKGTSTGAFPLLTPRLASFGLSPHTHSPNPDPPIHAYHADPSGFYSRLHEEN